MSPGELVRRVEQQVVSRVHRVRRAWLLGRIRALALLRRSDVVLDVAADLRVGRRVTVMLAPRTRVVLSIAPRCRIGDEVTLLLTSGELRWGEDVQLRTRSAVHLTGSFHCEGGNIFSYGSMIHCSESIRLGQWSGCAEYTTLADSAHFYTEPDVCVSENTVSSPIELGVNVFLAPRVSVSRGATMGDYSIAGPGSVVVGDVERATFVSGVPARTVGPIDLPWERAT